MFKESKMCLNFFSWFAKNKTKNQNIKQKSSKSALQLALFAC